MLEKENDLTLLNFAKEKKWENIFGKILWEKYKKKKKIHNSEKNNYFQNVKSFSCSPEPILLLI